MSDAMTEDDDLEIIEVEETPAEEPEAEAPEAEAEAPEEDDDDEDGDERLGESEDESEEDITTRNRIRRQKRKQARKAAQEALETELRETKAALAAQREATEAIINRLSAVEGVSLAQQKMGADQKLEEAQRKIEQAEHIIARAVEAGNGADVAAAIRLRDEAISEAHSVKAERDQLARERPPAVNPLVKSYAKQWMDANKWYDPKGSDEPSQIANRIDRGLLAEGYDPTTREYFTELTRRVEARFASAQAPAADPVDAPVRKTKAPPMGATREHAPATTKKNQVYVTPERRAAMEELGVWDDPAQRNQYLKAYAEYDRKTAAR